MVGPDALMSERLTRTTMTWLLVTVLVVAPVEVLSANNAAMLATLPVRFGIIAVTLWALHTDRLSPIDAGRMVLLMAVATTAGWSLLLDSSPAQLAFECTGYAAILSILTLLMAPRDQRRWWSLGVVGIILVVEGSRLLPEEALLFAQSVTILAVNGVGVAMLDVHANRVETASRMASIDPLTGLFNRRPTVVRLTEEVVAATSDGVDASVLILDLDHFKDLNDTLGHEAGDDALRAVAATLTSLVGRDDLVCGWGGEEFLVLIPGADDLSAARTAESFRTGIARTGVTGSVGVAGVRPGETVAAWVARADAAMYAAKQQGRNQVVRSPTMAPPATEPPATPRSSPQPDDASQLLRIGHPEPPHGWEVTATSG